MGKPLLKTLAVVAVGVGSVAICLQLDITRTINDNNHGESR